jgi:hypothetical protein
VGQALGRIAEAEARAGRAPGSVALCAVTKTFPPAIVAAAATAGVRDIGENRVQETAEKRPLVDTPMPLRWHLIGHLQSNKARRAVQLFEVIQTIDSLSLAERVDRIAGEEGRRPDVLIQVDLGHEAAKSGADEAETAEIAALLDRAQHVRLVGLMTLPPFFDDPEDARPFFRRLRELRDRLNDGGRLSGPLVELSMGMSHDFEIAVEEGATIVRVGTAIFGVRG